MRLSDEGDQFSMTHEWVAEHYEPKLKQVQDVPLGAFPWASQQLRRGETLYVPSLKQLSPEAEVDQRNWQQFHLQSLVGVPLIFQETVLGWVGFASFSREQHWPESHLQLLKIFGEILTNALQRQITDWELRQLNQKLEDRVAQRTTALRSSEQRFRSLFESAPDFIHILNPQGIIQQVNPTVVECSGFSEAELIGQPLVHFLSQDTQQTCIQEFQQLLQQGHHRQEMEFVCKDGSIRTMDCACTVVAEASEQSSYVLVMQRDVSDRKRAEATLQESERRWRSLLDNVRLIVVSLNRSGCLDYINPHGLEVLGYDQAEITGQNWFECCIPHHQITVIQQVFEDELAGDGCEQAYYQSPILTKSGKERLIAWNNTVLRDPIGASIGTISIGEDITECSAIQRMKDEFISVVSHELRTPLTSIHGALELLSAGILPLESERGQHVLSIAANNSTRLVRLVNDILELERLESGKINLEIQPVQTSELTHRARELIQVLAERSQVSLQIQDPGFELQADGDRIIQVLTNLLDNAVKFSPPEADVVLTVEVNGVALDQPGQPQQLLFTVEDHGRGIPSEQLDHIFGRFQQVDASDSRSKGGTGLGLAICRSIVRQHGGRIWAESELGQSSRFFFTLPLRSNHLE